jgi:D-3-phosphoglycerate dehydrogenase
MPDASGADLRVWFERSVSPLLEDLVDPRIMRLGPGTESDRYAGIEDARGVVAGIFPYGPEQFDRAPELAVVARTGIGVDTVDVAAATERGVYVCNAPDGPTISTAEHTIALMLAASKYLASGQRRLRDGEDDLYTRHEAVQLAGRTLGLVGYGRIARRVRRTAEALDMEVIAFDPYAADADTQLAPTLYDLAQRSDIISVHAPLTEDTRNLLDTEFFDAARPGVIVVNTARGGLIDQDALLAAVRSDVVAAAALDVTEPEPLPVDHPLLHDERIIVTPHVAAGTDAARRANFGTAVDEVVRVLQGATPTHPVNEPRRLHV